MPEPSDPPQPRTSRRGPRVVVGVDGSDASLTALGQARTEAGLRHAVLEVVHAWQFPFDLTAATYAVPAPAGEMKLWAEQVVDDALAALPPAVAGAHTEIVRRVEEGSPALVLADAAKGAELLVVGTRGHSRLTGLFLGSVSQYLVVHAPCPVLVVHGPRPPDDKGASPASSVVASSAPVPQLLEIDEDECLALLAGRAVGRLVVVHEGQPIALPVNYVLDGRTVAVRTDPGIMLDWATLGHVAFEIDEIDEQTRQGWSVLVQGIGHDVTDGVDEWSERLRGRELEPWAGGERQHWVALSSPRISGRRIVREAPSEVSAPLS
ncbi:MAG TPA: universal stress protein [Acidimicrobiales bacterium]|nr:universal stress protein [Acidimicrobiales bacterium]